MGAQDARDSNVIVIMTGSGLMPHKRPPKKGSRRVESQGGGYLSGAGATAGAHMFICSSLSRLLRLSDAGVALLCVVYLTAVCCYDKPPQPACGWTSVLSLQQWLHGEAFVRRVPADARSAGLKRPVGSSDERGLCLRARSLPCSRPRMLRLRGGGLIKKFAKGLPMNREEKKYWDMAKNGELHRLVQADSDRKSRRDLAILRKKQRARTLALKPAAQERLAARISEKARVHPLLKDTSSALARISAHSRKLEPKNRKGGRPDVWSQKSRGHAPSPKLAETPNRLLPRRAPQALPTGSKSMVDEVDAELARGGVGTSGSDAARATLVGWRFSEAQANKRRGEEEYLRKKDEEEKANQVR